MTIPLSQQIVSQDAIVYIYRYQPAQIMHLSNGAKEKDKVYNFNLCNRNYIPMAKQRLFDCASEKRGSSWIATLPIEEHGFLLHKEAFQDAIHLQYGVELPGTPSKCSCGATLLLIMP